jgi:hypothetical protein
MKLSERKLAQDLAADMYHVFLMRVVNMANYPFRFQATPFCK